MPSKNWKELSETRLKMKLLLMQFLDHCLKDEDYIIKEQHVLEKLCNIFFLDAKDKSVFYIGNQSILDIKQKLILKSLFLNEFFIADNNYSFNKVIVHGNEWLLATFETTVFAFFLALYNSYIFACVITVLISQLFFIAIKCNVKKNLSKKSLLDKRFLI